jgi:mannose-6-phosphate isomerase
LKDEGLPSQRAVRLKRQYVEKPWGRTELPAPFEPTDGRRIGEVLFVGPDLPLLVKYLFTSDRLSVQVHPDDHQARARGLQRGKSECWYVLDAEQGATIGLGLTRETSADELREAAMSGDIVELMDWRPVAGGDFFFIAPGTIHAIGGGISLLEFQQSSDITYRLYDYGRARELHLDDGIAVANRQPYPKQFHLQVREDEDCILVDGPDFKLLHSHSDALQQRDRCIMPLEGTMRSGGDRATVRECLFVRAGDSAEGEGRFLIGAAS